MVLCPCGIYEQTINLLASIIHMVSDNCDNKTHAPTDISRWLFSSYLQRRNSEIRSRFQGRLECCEEHVCRFASNCPYWPSWHSSGDSFVIFSGGMPLQADHQQTSSKSSSSFMTILRGQTTNVLHMDNAIVDFQVITASPHIAGSLSRFTRDAVDVLAL